MGRAPIWGMDQETLGSQSRSMKLSVSSFSQLPTKNHPYLSLNKTAPHHQHQHHTNTHHQDPLTTIKIQLSDPHPQLQLLLFAKATVFPISRVASYDLRQQAIALRPTGVRHLRHRAQARAITLTTGGAAVGPALPPTKLT